MNAVCPECNNVLTEVGNYIICGNCGYKVNNNQQPWYYEMAADKDLWNEEFLAKAPSILSFEYAALRNYLKNGSVYALPIKIKDNFEVIIKFCVLLKLSKALSSKGVFQKYSNILYKLLSKMLSMGDWKSIAQDILNISGKEEVKNDTILKILRDICRICDKNAIVSWRNNTIGHGALTPAETKEFELSIKEKIMLLKEHYSAFANDYADICLLLVSDKKELRLLGENMMGKIDFPNASVCYRIIDETRRLLPFVIYQNQSVYFFDSVLRNKNDYQYLDYIGGDKIVRQEKEIKRLYNKVEKHIGTRILDVSTEDKIYSKAITDIMEDFAKPSYPIKLNFLQDWVNDYIKNNANGLCMLCMEQGMGKTTFVRMINRYREIIIDNAVCRAFYINPVYAHTPQSFVQQITRELSITDDKAFLTGTFPEVNVLSQDAKKQFANLLNEFHKYYLKNYGKKNLVIFVDGLDEITYSEKNSIADVLPKKDMLDDGIYIVITCRTSLELSNYTQSLVKKLSDVEVLEVNARDEKYREALIKGVSKYIGKKDAVRIVDFAKNKVVNLGILLKAYAVQGSSGLDGLTENSVDSRFSMLENLYGSEYYKEILRLAVIIAMSPIGLSLNKISYLLGANSITFKDLSYLTELKEFINVYYSEDDMILSIVREDAQRYLLKCEPMISYIRKSLLDDLVNTDYNDKSISSFEIMAKLAEVIIIVEQNSSLLNDSIVEGIFSFVKTRIERHQKNDDDRLSVQDLWIMEVFLKDFIKLTDEFPNSFSRSLDSVFDIIAFERDKGNVLIAIEALECIYKKAKMDYIKIPSNKMAIFAVQLAAMYHFIDDMEKYNFYSKENDKYSYMNKHNFVEYDDILEHFKTSIDNAVMSKNSGHNDKAIIILENLKQELEYISGFEGITDSIGFKSINYGLYKTLGNVFKRTNPQKAMGYFDIAEKYLKLCANDMPNGQVLDYRYDFYLNKGQTYRVLKKYDEAIECYTRALSDIQKIKNAGKVYDVGYESNIIKSIANVEKERGNNRQALDNYVSAVGLMEKVISNGGKINNSAYADCYLAMSEVCSNLRDHESANKYYAKYMELAGDVNVEKAIQMKGNNEVNYIIEDKINSLIDRERYDEALEVINKYIDNNSDNAEFYLNRAICYSEGSTHDYRKAFADTIIGFVKYGDSRENLVSSKPKRIIGLCNLLIQCLYIYSIRVKELNVFAPVFLETARQLVLSHNIFGKTKEIYMPSENGRIALWDERAFDRNIIGFMKNSKYELNKDLESGCRLAIQAIQYLYTDISVEEKIEEVFIKWSPEASDEDLRNMSYFFPADVLAYSMFIKAALQGFYPAWRYIGSLYANDSFSFYNTKLATEFNSIYTKAAKEDSVNKKKIRELEITIGQQAKHYVFI